MTDHTIPDELVESVLSARAGDGAPVDLRRQIVAAALSDPAHLRLSGEGRGRLGPVRLLAIAAVLAAAAGALFVAGSSRLAMHEDMVPSQPVSTPPALVAEVPSPAPTPNRSPCPTTPLDDLEHGPDPSPGLVAPGRRSAGDLVYVAPAIGGLKQQLRHLGGDAIGDRFVPMPAEMAASPDGRWVALSTSGSGSFSCSDVLLVSVPDGLFRRPFTAGVIESLRAPTWSSDGATLYAIHRTLAAGPLAPPDDAGSMWAWDRTTDTSRDLGSPCAGCAVLAVYPSPDGRVVAAFGPAGCRLSPFDCGWGAAIVDDGAWRVVATPADVARAFDSAFSEPMGVAADGALIAHVGETVTFLALDGSGEAMRVERPCCDTLEIPALSPDGSAVAAIVMDRSGSPTLALLDTRTRAWRLAGTIGQQGGPYAAAWAPDLRQVAYLRYLSDGSSVLDIVATDGSGVEERPFTGGEAIAWLPATP